MSNDLIKADAFLNYLLVEGPDDAQVFFHLLRYHKLEKSIAIQPKTGIDNLLASLEVELMRRAETRLGLVVDADADIAARWQALHQKLLNAGYSTVPLHPDPAGTILQQEGRPTVGLWLMPDNIIPGMLEDFMRLLIPSDDLLWPVAEEVVQQVTAKDQRFPPTQSMKACIHTWLAWQEEPGKPMGQAITKRYFNADAIRTQPLLNWLRRLFDAK